MAAAATLNFEKNVNISGLDEYIAIKINLVDRCHRRYSYNIIDNCKMAFSLHVLGRLSDEYNF